MENKIKGYRELTPEEIDLINYFKSMESELNKDLDRISDPENGRNVALARTYLEIGFMFANKAVAKPESID